LIDVIVFNATFINISAISWQPVLVVELITDMLLKVPLNTNKTGQHVVSYNRYIVESGIEYQEN
jgi:hypothetical protein